MKTFKNKKVIKDWIKSIKKSKLKTKINKNEKQKIYT